MKEGIFSRNFMVLAKKNLIYSNMVYFGIIFVDLLSLIQNLYKYPIAALVKKSKNSI